MQRERFSIRSHPCCTTINLRKQKCHRLVAGHQFLLACCNKLANFIKLQQTCQFHQIVTSLLKSDLLQLVICRLVIKTCSFNKTRVALITSDQEAVASRAHKSRYWLDDNTSTDLLQLHVFGCVHSLMCPETNRKPYLCLQHLQIHS